MPSYRGPQTYDVEVTFTREAAPLVTETTWHSTQKIPGTRTEA